MPLSTGLSTNATESPFKTIVDAAIILPLLWAFYDAMMPALKTGQRMMACRAL